MTDTFTIAASSSTPRRLHLRRSNLIARAHGRTSWNVISDIGAIEFG